MTRRTLVVALVVLVAFTSPALQQDAVVVGRPDLSVVARDDALTWGPNQSLSVYVSNDGQLTRGGPPALEERVTTARNVRVEILTERLDEPVVEAIEVETGPVPVGSVPVGLSGPFRFGLSVSPALEPGSYEVPFGLAYEYTSVARLDEGRAPVYTGSTASTVEVVTVEVVGRPRFEVSVPAGQAVRAGETGRYRFVLSNTGTATATDLGVSLRTDNVSVFFGDGSRSAGSVRLYVPSLAPGESRRLTVTVTADEATAPGSYLVGATVRYRTQSGDRGEARGLRFGVNVTSS